MRWLRALLTPSEPPREALQRTVNELRQDVADLSLELSRLKKEWASEQAALADLTAKMTAWVGRLAARERKKAAAQLELQDPDSFDQAAAAAPGNGHATDVRFMNKAQLRHLAANLRQGRPQ